LTSRLAASLIAVAAAAIAFLHPAFRTAGALSASFVVPLAVSVSGLAWAIFGRPGRQRALGWLSLLLIGQAAALQLVQAGPGIGYQHYRPWSHLLDAGVLPWTCVVLLQAVAVVAGAMARARPVFERFVDDRRRGQVVFLGLAFIFTSATLSRDLLQYAGELVLASCVQGIGLANVVLMAVSIPGPDALRLGAALDRLLGPTSAPDANGTARAGFWRLDRFVIGAALFALIATALLSLMSYQRHPHIPDEVTYIIQAKYFAKGMLWMPAPPVPSAFDLDLMTYEPTRWYSPVNPGWSMVLALGVKVGAGWLVNPVLSGIAVVFAYILLRELRGIRFARIATVLLCSSPWFLFLGMSFMTHQLTLVAGLAAATCTARLRRGGSAWWAAAAGLGLGVIGPIRPLEGVIAAAALGLWALAGRPRTRHVLQVAVMAATSIAAASSALLYNRAITGKATTFPIMAYTDAHYGPGSNALGFGANRGIDFGGLDPFPGHGPVDVIINTNFNLFQVNTELLGWATGSLLLVFVLLVSGRMTRVDRAMLGVVVLVAFAHVFYWFSGGPDFGARYWYIGVIAFIALVAGGCESVVASMATAENRARALSALLALSLSTLIVFVPWRAADKYYHYRGMQPGVRRLLAHTDFGRSLVLVRGRRHPDYASAAVYNSIDLSEPRPIFVWDRDEETRARVLQAFGDRPVWIVDGPTITHDGYRLVAGPIPPGQPIEIAR
jgi:4-amino-4-deoxy-L-arabinose transferase-like glycosyltransferase